MSRSYYIDWVDRRILMTLLATGPALSRKDLYIRLYQSPRHTYDFSNRIDRLIDRDFIETTGRYSFDVRRDAVLLYLLGHASTSQ